MNVGGWCFLSHVKRTSCWQAVYCSWDIGLTSQQLCLNYNVIKYHSCGDKFVVTTERKVLEERHARCNLSLDK